MMGKFSLLSSRLVSCLANQLSTRSITAAILVWVVEQRNTFEENTMVLYSHFVCPETTLHTFLLFSQTKVHSTSTQCSSVLVDARGIIGTTHDSALS